MKRKRVLKLAATVSVGWAEVIKAGVIGAPSLFEHLEEKGVEPSFIAPVCLGQIAGFGWQSYVLGLETLLMALAKN